MIKRTILTQLKQHLREPEITLITGSRQVGKSTLMDLMMDDLRKEGQKVLSLSLDFEHDRPFFESQDALIRRIRLEIGEEKGFVFLDEIQQKEDAGRFLKGLYDMKLPWKMIVSGSGSIELKERISESLAGRKRVFEVFPVSFTEMIDYRTDYKYSGNLQEYTTLFYGKSLEYLNEYLSFGGYPKVVTSCTLREKLVAINEIYRSYIDRDIRPLIRNDQPDAYSRLIRLLAAQTGQMVNVSNLANEAQLSVPTVHKHLWIGSRTYFLRLVEPYFNNISKEIVKAPVIYFADPGMRNYANSTFGDVKHPHEISFAFQNLVGNTLIQELDGTPFRVQYWRTTDKAEVDFIITRHHNPIGVEVKFSSMKAPTVTRSLRSFIEKYNPSEAWVINLSLTAVTEVNSTVVKFLSFFDLPQVIEELVTSVERNLMVEERMFVYMYTRRRRDKGH